MDNAADQLKDKNILPDPINYDKMRQLGLDYIGRIGGKLWNDFNLHDPGITTLELLCYSLVDLGYRTSFDMKDILTPQGAMNYDVKDHFIEPSEILPSHPLTPTDYRKLLLEHFPGLRNVMVIPSTQIVEYPVNCIMHEWEQHENRLKSVPVSGYYKVYYQLENSVKEQTRIYKQRIEDFLEGFRNLCENFCLVSEMPEIPVGIFLDVELSQQVIDNDSVLRKIYQKIYDYFTPSITRYTLAERLESGKPVDEILQGVVVGSSFVDTDELERFTIKKDLYHSDILNLLMSMPEVVNVKNFRFLVPENQEGVTITRYGITLKKGNNQTFCFDSHKSQIYFSQGRFMVKASEIPFKPYSPAIEEMEEMSDPKLDLALPQGRYRGVDKYISFQKIYPPMYGLNLDSSRTNETVQQKAQRMQFRGYLLFFDQLLADYLAQLSSIRHLYSWQDHSDNFDQDKSDTYFFNRLKKEQILEVDRLIKDYEGYNHVQESNAIKFNRKARFLDNLIARFNETFVDYSINAYREKYYTRMTGKRRFLRNYASISLNRTKAFNLRRPLNSENVTMLEARILSKLGIETTHNRQTLTPEYVKKGDLFIFDDNRKIDVNNAFGVHVVEHSILLARYLQTTRGKYSLGEDTFFRIWKNEDCRDFAEDPYSMKISVIFPGWLDSSSDMGFRKFVEDIVRDETPAHIMVRILWVDPYQMHRFEQAYSIYLRLIGQPYNSRYRKRYEFSLRQLVSRFSGLHSIYAPFKLYDINQSLVDASRLDFGSLPDDTENRLWRFATIDKKLNN